MIDLNENTGAKQIVVPSALYPFTKEQVHDFEYREFQLLNVFRSISEEQRKQCVNMWLKAGAVPTEELAWQRSAQVCYMFFHKESGRLVGVNTLYSETDTVTNEKWFVNRMFILPKFRTTRLMIVGTSLMLYFASLHLAHEGMKGVVNINVNIKLHRKGLRKIFSSLGYQFSHAADKREIWFFDFSKVSFISQQ